jgi:hypothetical protein
MVRKANESLTVSLEQTHRELEQYELDYSTEREKSQLLIAQLATQDTQVEYLKGQIEIYQTRMGILMPKRDGSAEVSEPKPIRKSREPFEALSQRVAKAQADKTEEYWKARAAQVSVDGVTTPDSKETTDAKPS